MEEAVRRRGKDEPAAVFAFDEALMGEGELERPEDPAPPWSAEMPANEEESDRLI